MPYLLSARVQMQKQSAVALFRASQSQLADLHTTRNLNPLLEQALSKFEEVAGTLLTRRVNVAHTSFPPSIIQPLIAAPVLDVCLHTFTNSAIGACANRVGD